MGKRVGRYLNVDTEIRYMAVTPMRALESILTFYVTFSEILRSFCRSEWGFTKLHG